MEGRYILELAILVVLILLGIILRKLTKRKLKDIEDAGRIVSGEEGKGKIVNAGEEDEA